MSTPVPSAPVGPLLRALVEALESIAARDSARALLRRALLDAELGAVPEDVVGFRLFVEGSLREAIERSLGAGVADIVIEQLGHVMRVSSPSLTGDTDEPSGERSVEAFSDPAPKTVRARPDVTAALRAPVDRAPLVAPVLFPSRSSGESGTTTKRSASAPTAIARVSSPGLSPPARSDSRAGLEEVRASRSGSRAIATDVIVVTLDPTLVSEVEARMRGRSRVLPVVTLPELMSALASISSPRVAIVLDTGVPSIDVPTFAGLGAAIPPSAHVILWGTDERQKKRLGTIFPQARSWIPSGAAESPADLLLDDQAR